MSKTLQETLNELSISTKEEFAMTLASRDALYYGYGLMAIDKEGNMIYVDIDEAAVILEAMRQNEVIRNR